MQLVNLTGSGKAGLMLHRACRERKDGWIPGGQQSVRTRSRGGGDRG